MDVDTRLPDSNAPMNLVDVNGYNIRFLHYLDKNMSTNKSILVLLHGIGASADRWSYVSPALSKYFHLIIPDIVGFGYSDKPTVEYTMDFFVSFFENFLAKL